VRDWCECNVPAGIGLLDANCEVMANDVCNYKL
jgi:hypothetical protein